MRKTFFSVSSSSDLGVKLHEFIAEYQNEGSEDAFADAVMLLHPIAKIVAEKVHRLKGVCCHDVQAAIDAAIWKAFDTFDQTKAQFTTYLTNLVNNEINDVLAEKEGTYAKNCTVAYEAFGWGEEDRFIAPVTEYCNGYARVATKSLTYDQFNELPDTCNVEDTVIDHIMNGERRDLIDDLCSHAPDKVHEVVQNVVNEAVRRPYDSFNAIAKSLGKHHFAVARGLRKLAGFYSEKKHGNVNDYLYRSKECSY